MLAIDKEEGRPQLIVLVFLTSCVQNLDSFVRYSNRHIPMGDLKVREVKVCTEVFVIKFENSLQI